jgi:hypothetical protein
MEAMRDAGAMTIGGSSRVVASTFIVGGCDYSLIGEEALAAGAYVSKDPVARGSFQGQDYTKFGVISLIVVGVLMTLFGVEIIQKILGM